MAGQVFQQALAQPETYVDPYAEQLAAMRAALAKGQAPQFTPEQVAQRRGANQRDYELGMLGQLSGDESLGAVGGQIFKQALAARQPHITERGMADQISGDWTYNPAYLREKDEAQLAGLEAKSAGARGAWSEARQRAQERAEQQAQHAADQKELRALMHASTAGNQANVQAGRLWSVEDRMADDFRKETGKDQQVMGAFNGLKATAAKGDAASDMALIFQYMKTLDPSSTVREGEFATVQNAAGIDARVLNYYNRARAGNFLNKQQRVEMLGVAERLAKQSEANINQTAARYRETAQRRPGINVESIVGPYGAAAPAKPAAAAALPRAGAL